MTSGSVRGYIMPHYTVALQIRKSVNRQTSKWSMPRVVGFFSLSFFLFCFILFFFFFNSAGVKDLSRPLAQPDPGKWGQPGQRPDECTINHGMESWLCQGVNTLPSTKTHSLKAKGRSIDICFLSQGTFCVNSSSLIDISSQVNPLPWGILQQQKGD